MREFLKEQGVADYQLVDSQGATEGVVKNETAEAIADITSTGLALKMARSFFKQHSSEADVRIGQTINAPRFDCNLFLESEFGRG